MSDGPRSADAHPRKTPGSILDHAIEQIADEALRRTIKAEVEKLRGTRRFGLVFDRHLPETVRLPCHPVRKGNTAALRDESSFDTWVVTGFTDRSRTTAVLDDGTRHPVTDLVVVREFGEPVYPGLETLERFATGPADAPWHTVINGENYHVLQALRSTHRGKIDIIYIDPPYNTGSAEWQYNDRFVDKTDRARSSKWLSFMERRLVIALDLLKPTGVIFVSIGDDEQHQLRMLMDQVFQPDNCVVSLAVEMSTTSGPKTVNAQQGTIVKNIEYVQVYRKGPEFDEVPHTPLLDSVPQWDRDYTMWLNDDGTITNFVDEIAADPAVKADIEKFGFVTARGRFIGMNCMNKLLAVSQAANDFVLANLERIARRDTPPASCRDMDAPVRGWIEVEADRRTYTLTRLPSGTLNQLYTLARNYRKSDDYRPRFGRTVIRGDLWKGFYQDMGNVAKEGGVSFNNGKKPIRLIKQLIRWANNSPNAVILDFFGGSGTTTHAIMAMNAEDQGKRRSILVTNNEVGPKVVEALRKNGLHPGDTEWEAKGVFESVTRPRVRTAVTGTRPDGTRYSDGLSANVEFLRLAYLDPGMVRRGQEFAAIAPMLWLEAGGVGERIESEPEEGWSIADTYAILFDSDATAPFADAVTKRVLDNPGSLRLCIIVTDSDTAYEHALSRLPQGIPMKRLYEDYLSNFEINVEVAR